MQNRNTLLKSRGKRMKQLDPVLVHIRNDIKVMDIANYSRIVTTKKSEFGHHFLLGLQ